MTSSASYECLYTCYSITSIYEYYRHNCFLFLFWLPLQYCICQSQSRDSNKGNFFLYSFHDIAALIFFVKIVWTSSGLFPFIYTNDLCIFYITVGIATALGYGCTAWYPNLTQIKQGAISYKNIVTMDYLLISQKSSQYFKVFNFKCTSDKQPAD